MRFLSFILALLLGIYAAVIFIFPLTPFANQLSQRMAEELSSRLGHKTVIQGALEIDVFPRPYLALTNILIKNNRPPHDLLARVKKLEIELNFSALFQPFLPNQSSNTAPTAQLFLSLLGLKGVELYANHLTKIGMGADLFPKGKLHPDLVKPLRALLAFDSIEISQLRWVERTDTPLKKSQKTLKKPIITHPMMVHPIMVNHGVIKIGHDHHPFQIDSEIFYQGKIYQMLTTIGTDWQSKPVDVKIALSREEDKINFNGVWHKAFALKGMLDVQIRVFGKKLESVMKVKIDKRQIRFLTRQAIFDSLSIASVRGRLLWDGDKITLDIERADIAQSANPQSLKKTQPIAQPISKPSAHLKAHADWQKGNLNADIHLKTSHFGLIARQLGVALPFTNPKTALQSDMVISIKAVKNVMTRLALKGKLANTDFQTHIDFLPKGSTNTKPISARVKIFDINSQWRGNLLKTNHFWQVFEGVVDIKTYHMEDIFQRLGLGGYVQAISEDRDFSSLAKIKISPQSVMLHKARARLAHRHLLGNLSLIKRGDLWHIKADLSSKALPIKLLSKPSSKNIPDWRQKIWRMPKNFSANITLQAQKMILGDMSLTDSKLHFSFSPQAFNVRSFKARLGQGGLKARANLSFKGKTPKLNLSLETDAIDWNDLAPIFGKQALISGQLHSHMKITSEGDSFRDWVEEADGRGHILVEKAGFLGFQGDLLNQSLPLLRSFTSLPIVLDYIFRIGRTPIGMIESDFTLQKGKLTLKPSHWVLPNLNMKWAFQADLAKKTIQADFSFLLPAQPKAPPLFWRIGGDWANPQRRLDMVLFQKMFLKTLLKRDFNQDFVQKNPATLPSQIADLLKYASTP